MGGLKGGDVVTQESDFKFISVEEDDDEIVIQAGAVPSDAEDALREPMEQPDEPDEGIEDYAGFDDALDEDSPEEDEDALEREKFERAKARRQAMAEANRMVTTEEDLKASVPFAGMQRVIIIVAIVLIAVFVAYYKLGGM